MLLKNALILGVDPGSQITGYAFIRVHKDNPSSLSDFSVHSWGTIKAPRQLSFVDRLGHLHHQLHELITQEKTDHCVIEDTFVRHHLRSALKLSQARGALIVAASRCAVPIHEMTAPQAKKAITGKGNTTKQEVAFFLRTLLHSPHSTCLPSSCPEDVTDALALALAWGIESSLQTRLSLSAPPPSAAAPPFSTSAPPTKNSLTALKDKLSLPIKGSCSPHKP